MKTGCSRKTQQKDNPRAFEKTLKKSERGDTKMIMLLLLHLVFTSRVTPVVTQRSWVEIMACFVAASAE